MTDGGVSPHLIALKTMFISVVMVLRFVHYMSQTLHHMTVMNLLDIQLLQFMSWTFSYVQCMSCIFSYVQFMS
jgi:hypothetical protein